MLAPINLGCDLRKSINLTFGNRLTTFPGVPRTIPPHPLNLYLVISNQWISRILILPLSGDSQSSDLGPTVPIGKSQRGGQSLDLWLEAHLRICGCRRVLTFVATNSHIRCTLPVMHLLFLSGEQYSTNLGARAMPPPHPSQHPIYTICKNSFDGTTQKLPQLI